MNDLPKGFSFQINGGCSGGWYISFTRLSWRIALGPLAITLFFFDIEPVFHKGINAINEIQHEENVKKSIS